MLVLSRKLDQEILINGNIKISVLKIKGNVVRIGIEAPSEISIKRGELETQAIELPVAETVDDTVDQASFTLSLDTSALEVSEEAEGFQLLPLSTDEASVDAASASCIAAHFPETLQRNLYCDPIAPSTESA